MRVAFFNVITRVQRGNADSPSITASTAPPAQNSMSICQHEEREVWTHAFVYVKHTVYHYVQRGQCCRTSPTECRSLTRRRAPVEPGHLWNLLWGSGSFSSGVHIINIEPMAQGQQKVWWAVWLDFHNSQLRSPVKLRWSCSQGEGLGHCNEACLGTLWLVEEGLLAVAKRLLH